MLLLLRRTFTSFSRHKKIFIFQFTVSIINFLISFVNYPINFFIILCTKVGHVCVEWRQSWKGSLQYRYKYAFKNIRCCKINICQENIITDDSLLFNFSLTWNSSHHLFTSLLLSCFLLPCRVSSSFLSFCLGLAWLGLPCLVLSYIGFSPLLFSSILFTSPLLSRLLSSPLLSSFFLPLIFLMWVKAMQHCWCINTERKQINTMWLILIPLGLPVSF